MRPTHAAFAAVLCTALIAAAPAKPPGLDAARKAFVKTLQAKDWNGLANLVAWPLPVENYGSLPSLPKAKYLKDHTKLTIYMDDAGLQTCLATAPAQLQSDRTQFGFGSWVVDCNGNEFYFGLKSGKVLFTGYQNVNE